MNAIELAGAFGAWARDHHVSARERDAVLLLIATDTEFVAARSWREVIAAVQTVPAQKAGAR